MAEWSSFIRFLSGGIFPRASLQEISVHGEYLLIGLFDGGVSSFEILPSQILSCSVMSWKVFLMLLQQLIIYKSSEEKRVAFLL